MNPEIEIGRDGIMIMHKVELTIIQRGITCFHNFGQLCITAKGFEIDTNGVLKADLTLAEDL